MDSAFISRARSTSMASIKARPGSSFVSAVGSEGFRSDDSSKYHLSYPWSSPIKIMVFPRASVYIYRRKISYFYRLFFGFMAGYWNAWAGGGGCGDFLLRGSRSSECGPSPFNSDYPCLWLPQQELAAVSNSMLFTTSGFVQQKRFSENRLDAATPLASFDRLRRNVVSCTPICLHICK